MGTTFFDEDLKTKDADLYQYLSKTYFDHPLLQCQVGLEGQGVSPTGVVTLGCRAGPGIEIFNLLHEMSHFVEIDDARIQARGYGLRHGKFMSLGRASWREFRTSQAVRRELRVGAFQFHLTQQLGLDTKEFVAEYVETCKYLPTDALCSLADEENCRTPDGVVDTERATATVLSRLIEDPAYSFERLKREWKRKQGLLKEKYETLP